MINENKYLIIVKFGKGKVEIADFICSALFFCSCSKK